VIVLGLGVIFVLAALAIDLSSWYQKRHQAQVTADAAALAAANYMSHSGTSATTATASATATSTATTYASQNNLPISGSNVDVNTTASLVTVTVPTHGSGFFEHLFGSAGPAITAVAKASWKTTNPDCTTKTNTCAFIFANDNKCPGGAGVQISVNGTGNASAGLSGTILSNSNISISTTGSPHITSAAEYSNATGCTATNGSTFAGGTSTYTVPLSWPDDWPIDYRDIYTPCGTGYLYACNGPSGTPHYCDFAAVNFTATTLGAGTYCAYGTGKVTDPTTWNGAISVSNDLDNSTGTFVGGKISIPSTLTITPYTGANAASKTLLGYATSSADSASACTSDAICITGSGHGGNLSGDIFAPNGGAYLALGGNQSFSGLIEAYDVYYSSHGTDTADGPDVGTTGGPLPSSDSLVG
jgi:hypothetical protein